MLQESYRVTIEGIAREYPEGESPYGEIVKDYEGAGRGAGDPGAGGRQASGAA